MDERQALCDAGSSFQQRGMAFGATGNLSVRLGDAVWITPTGRALGGLVPSDLACVDLEGGRTGEQRPSKEWPFHLAVYRARPDLAAIVHLHSTWSVALSCLDTLDQQEPLPPLTPYYVMRVAPLGVVSYFKPGSKDLGDAIGAAAIRHHALLLRHHGLVTGGRSLAAAVECAEELEETARLWFILRGMVLRTLSPTDVAALTDLRKRHE